MRKWMRDRVKRRKKPGTGPDTNAGADQGPAPLQPTFLDRDNSEWTGETPAEPSAEQPQPEYEAQPEVVAEDGEAPAEAEAEAQPSARTGGKRERSRRRGRRGKGNRAAGQGSGEPPVLPIAPGQATGEAAEVGFDGSAPEAPAPAEPAAKARREKRPKKPKGAVVLAIGLPGSGKSSWFKRHSIMPLSSDLVRGLLFDDPTEQRFQDLVFSTLRTMLRARMLATRPWNYIDATNLSPKERHSWIKMAHDFGYEAHAVYFDVPTEVCMERNRKRSRNVPEDVMTRMSQKLRPPTFEEGFARITVVRLKKAESPTEAEEGEGENSGDE